MLDSLTLSSAGSIRQVSSSLTTIGVTFSYHSAHAYSLSFLKSDIYRHFQSCIWLGKFYEKWPMINQEIMPQYAQSVERGPSIGEE